MLVAFARFTRTGASNTELGRKYIYHRENDTETDTGPKEHVLLAFMLSALEEESHIR